VTGNKGGRSSARSTLLAGLTLAASLALSLFGAGEATAATFIVTSNAATGVGLLAAAITASNTAGGSNTIVFNLPSGSAIVNASSLPNITNIVVIDGGTNPGGQVTINGNGNRPFFLGDGGITTPASPFAITLQNMTITGA
jgi:hypothetical protein